MTLNRFLLPRRAARFERLESRLHFAAGDVDATFGQRGLASLNVIGKGAAIAVQQDQRTVLAGTADVNGAYTLIVTRLNPDGSRDASFAAGGEYRLALAGAP